MRTIFIVVILSMSLLSQPGRSDNGKMTGLCTANEQVFFSCVLANSSRTVSLCGSRDLTKTEGYLQYRFGKPASLELEYPKEKNSSLKKFVYDHYFRSLVDRTEIKFENNGYAYTLFDYYEAEEKPVRQEKGITVETNSTGKEITLKCSRNVVAHYEKLPELFSEQ